MGDYLCPGELEPRAAVVRVIAVSTTPLEERVAQARFRVDLLERLATIAIVVPPLCVEAERRELLTAIERAHGNKSRAARLLKVSRKTLYARLHRHGLALAGEASQHPAPRGAVRTFAAPPAGGLRLATRAVLG